MPDTHHLFSSPENFRRFLAACGIRNVERGIANFDAIRSLGWSDREVSRFILVLAKALPKVADPDQALNNIDRLVSTSPSVSQKIRTLSSLATPFEGLLTLLSDSQYLADLLRDESNLDEIIRARFQPVARQLLIGGAIEFVKTAKDFSEAMRRLRVFKQRETIRIAWCDLVLDHRVEQVTEQISSLAASVCEAALHWCRARLEEKFGPPFSAAAERCRFVILGLGKLGGNELNYSSDIDLIAVYEFEGKVKSNAINSNRCLLYTSPSPRDRG